MSENSARVRPLIVASAERMSCEPPAAKASESVSSGNEPMAVTWPVAVLIVTSRTFAGEPRVGVQREQQPGGAERHRVDAARERERR